MRITALDNYDNVQEGTTYECPDHQAERLIKKGLAKLGPVPLNKMAEPSLNKQNPSPAAGEVRPSSASPAAPASLLATAQPYPGGGLVTPDPRLAEAEAEEQKTTTAARKTTRPARSRAPRSAE